MKYIVRSNLHVIDGSNVSFGRSITQRRIQDLKIEGAQPKILKNRGGAAENFRKLTCTFNGWYPKNRGGARLLRPPGSATEGKSQEQL